MNNITATFENFGHNVSHAWESCASVVTTTCQQIGETYESGRQRLVQFTSKEISPDVAYVVERISLAVPEVFVALASLWNGILTIPALIVSWGRKVEPILPFIRSVLRGDMTSKGLGDGLRDSLDNMNRMFERVLVPSLFVAFLVDTVYSFAMGWIAQDWKAMLHSTAISLPGLFLTFRYMALQRVRDQEAEAIGFDDTPEITSSDV